MTADCPGTKRLFGTGFRLDGPDGNARVDAVIPHPDLRHVTVHAVHSGPPNQVTAFGVCHDVAVPMRVVEASVPLDGTWPKLARANGDPRNVLYGVGGVVTGGGAFLDALVADPRNSTAAVRAVPVSGPAFGARLAADDGDGGSVTAYGIDIGMFC